MKTIAMIFGLISILFTPCFSGTTPSVSNTYYVSRHGDDQNAGHSPATAWRSAAKVNSMTFAPGDRILFERGGEWHEPLIASSNGSPDNPIVYDAYGDPNAAKPTFWGSDVIPNTAFKDEGSSIYSCPVSVLPTSNAYWVFADHAFLAASISSSKMPERSFFISGSTIYIQTGGANPRDGKVVYTVTDRAFGVDADSSLICSNGHDNLVFENLIGRETADVADGGNIGNGVPDGYVFRIQGSSNVRLNDCEAYNGGKHHIGVINSTGFVGTRLYAAGCVPNLPFGHAGAFVSFSDPSRRGDTSQWIDCKVDHFDPQQQSFYTHGPGMGNLLIQNLSSIGCGFGIGTDGPGEIVRVKGGLLTGPTCDIYGSGVVIDGMRLRGPSKIELFGDKNIVQNCVDQQSTNAEGGIVCRGKQNLIRFNTLAHDPNAGPCIDIKDSAAGTRVIGNLFTGTIHDLNDDGSSGLTVDYNFADNSAGKPQGLSGDIHLVLGNPKFVDASSGNYLLSADSPAINQIPPGMMEGILTDYLGKRRPVGAGYDIGAFERQ